jgi:hypothetical protein
LKAGSFAAIGIVEGAYLEIDEDFQQRFQYLDGEYLQSLRLQDGNRND